MIRFVLSGLMEFLPGAIIIIIIIKADVSALVRIFGGPDLAAFLMALCIGLSVFGTCWSWWGKRDCFDGFALIDESLIESFFGI